MPVTASSAAFLSREVATALRGRGWRVLIHPFSFDEALRHRGRSVPDDAAELTGRERTRLERALLDPLGVGGFPEPRGLDAPSLPSLHQLLRDYVDVAILRDGADPGSSGLAATGVRSDRAAAMADLFSATNPLPKRGMATATTADTAARVRPASFTPAGLRVCHN